MKTIKIGGQERPFRFSYRALKMFMKKTNSTFDNMDIGVETIEDAIFCGLTCGYKYDKKKIDFKESDIEDWLDEDLLVIKTATKIIEDSFAKLNEEGEPEKK